MSSIIIHCTRPRPTRFVNFETVLFLVFYSRQDHRPPTTRLCQSDPFLKYYVLNKTTNHQTNLLCKSDPFLKYYILNKTTAHQINQIQNSTFSGLINQTRPPTTRPIYLVQVIRFSRNINWTRPLPTRSIDFETVLFLVFYNRQDHRPPD
jgi:hypothetical protein